ncbi:hypothetical protein B0H14DRAFT_3857742 [Mycena olivaceomarginata]|nr:hypothetical protein B0H14DRAFT_3857742 [Mycena olivaceomarginata]
MASSRNYPRFVDRLWDGPGAVSEAVRIDGKPDLNCPLPRSRCAFSIYLNRAFVSLSLSHFQDDVGLATFMAWPRILHGMPIRDLWAPPQLGRLPTRVAMYFPTPSAAAVDRSLFTGLFLPHSPTQYALSSSLFSLQFFLLLLSPTPSSCTLSSHRFESSSLPPPFPPHCNSLLVGSSPIHPPLPAMSSRSLRSSTHPCIHSGCGAVRPFSSHSPSSSLVHPHSLSPSGSQSTSHTTILLSCLSSANEESPYPRIHV